MKTILNDVSEPANLLVHCSSNSSSCGGNAKIFPSKEISKKDFFKNPIGSGSFKIIER